MLKILKYLKLLIKYIPAPPLPKDNVDVATSSQCNKIIFNSCSSSRRTLSLFLSIVCCFAELPQKEIPLTSEQELALLTDYVSFLEN